MTKNEALAQVRRAAMALSSTQPGLTQYSVERFREANTFLVEAELAAADAGASPAEINSAAEWNGRGV